jgi:hypothetical protein
MISIGSRMTIPIIEIDLFSVPVGAIHESGHRDMTTIED